MADGKVLSYHSAEGYANHIHLLDAKRGEQCRSIVAILAHRVGTVGFFSSPEPPLVIRDDAAMFRERAVQDIRALA